MTRPLTFEVWKLHVACAIARELGASTTAAEAYVRGITDEWWRDRFDAGLSPLEAANDEIEDMKRAPAPEGAEAHVVRH